MEITWNVDTVWDEVVYIKGPIQMGYINSVKLFRPFMGYSLLGVF